MTSWTNVIFIAALMKGQLLRPYINNTGISSLLGSRYLLSIILLCTYIWRLTISFSGMNVCRFSFVQNYVHFLWFSLIKITQRLFKAGYENTTGLTALQWRMQTFSLALYYYGKENVWYKCPSPVILWDCNNCKTFTRDHNIMAGVTLFRGGV